ncbi:glycosyltransferase [Pseudoroseomonas wenyumeiae]
MLRVATLSTLFPNQEQPNFGVFVEGQTLRLAACEDVELRVVNPVAMPLFPLNQLSRYRQLRGLPEDEVWKGVRVSRPRLRVLPGLSGPFNPSLLVQAARPVLQRWREEGFAFDVIDAQFLPGRPCGGAAGSRVWCALFHQGPGADIHYWGRVPGCRPQILRAASKAKGMLAVAQSLRRDMVSMGMDPARIAVHYTGVDLERFRPMTAPPPRRGSASRAP